MLSRLAAFRQCDIQRITRRIVLSVPLRHAPPHHGRYTLFNPPHGFMFVCPVRNQYAHNVSRCYVVYPFMADLRQDVIAQG